MKIKTLLVAAVLAISHPTVASTSVNGGNIELCKQVESVASKIMKKRQDGVPMMSIVDLIEKQGNDSFSKLFIEITKDAYSYPQFRTQSFKAQSVSEFGNEWALKCLNLTK
jgi:hypothetical protein